MPKVYIAGPMRGIPQFNFPAFLKADRWLRALGYLTFNPAQHDLDLHGQEVMKSETGNNDEAEQRGFDLGKALRDDLTYIAMEADAVCVLPGWENSSGANAEVALARALGKPVAQLRDFGALTVDVDKDKRYYSLVLNLTGHLEFHGYSNAYYEHTGPEPTKIKYVDDSPTGYAQPKSNIKVSKVVVTPVETIVEEDKIPSWPSGEIISVSSSGGQKGTKLARFDLIPAKVHWQLAEHFGIGARKYADRNWELGYEWGKSIAALERHVNLFKQGIDYDSHNDDCKSDCVEHTGSLHVICALWHCYVLAEFFRVHPEFDDRAKG